MALAVKYKFRFESIHGIMYVVNLLEDGYSGSVIVRPLGKAPVIKMSDSTPIRATSCSLTLECQTDGEFTSLYTSNPRQYQIQVYRDASLSGGGTLIWTGYVATEIYSEPDIAPPYDVAITATDGLGVLREYTFPARGLQPVREQLNYLLRQTGMTNPIRCVTSLQPNSGSPIVLFDSRSINLDYMAGENCYDVLSELLRTLHMTVTQYRGMWYLIRESDVAGKLNSSGTIATYDVPSRANASSSTTTANVTNFRKTVGQMGVANLWPVGYMTRRASPAKKDVTIEAPWHMGNAVQNPDMASDSVWSKGGFTWNSNGYYESTANTVGFLSQDVALEVTGGMRFKMTIRASRGVYSEDTNFVVFRPEFQANGSSTIYYFNTQTKKWDTTNPQYYDSFELQTMNSDRNQAEEFTLEVPALPFNNGVVGTLTVRITGRNANIFSVVVTQHLNAGYRDILVLNNGARGASEPVTIAGGRTDADLVPDGDLLEGVFVSSSSPKVIEYFWRDARWAGKDFLSMTALDYALSVALPRIELSGTLDVPSNLTHIPFVLSLRSTDYVLQSYDWDLLEEELRFTALSLPAATLTVSSENITSL